MTKLETTSWIFLALAISSEKAPTNFAEISQIADGINHSIPTQNELQESITWLIQNNLVLKKSKKFSLTETGKIIYLEAQNETRILIKMWKAIEIQLTKMKSVV
ncbi:hypothetical protein KIH23_10190 [Flavobacterium sp. CYK-55]|uniref:hypothetical protein n=1 Tax=Flavobacterium sp. CYK-55 TaxID=2835529 RepID=UPI001BCBED68|nr:hypothetical protein [Flavobacterium sp. CYK-55]MBS7787667.1 hypothetical protein [Flavobacterium sp. CYK-55]